LSFAGFQLFTGLKKMKMTAETTKEEKSADRGDQESRTDVNRDKTASSDEALRHKSVDAPFDQGQSSDQPVADVGDADIAFQRSRKRPSDDIPQTRSDSSNPAKKRREEDGQQDVEEKEVTRFIRSKPDAPLISQEESEALQKKLNDAIVGGKIEVEIDSWLHNKSEVVVILPTPKDAKALEDFLKDEFVIQAPLHDQEGHAPVRLIALVDHVTASISDQDLSKLVQRHKDRKGYDGRFQLAKKTLLPSGKARVELEIARELVEQFRKDGNKLRFGASGFVLFEDKDIFEAKIFAMEPT
jgi:hypothetical protein